jgi:uncharacterized protein (TIGR03083 family)
MTIVRTTIPMTTPEDAVHVTSEELSALLDLLRELPGTDWARPTPCTGWTVRDLAAHVAGALEEAARLTVQLRHVRTANKRAEGTAFIDAMTRLQVQARAGRTPDQLVAEIATIGPRAIRAGRRLPGPLRRRTLPDTGALPPGSTLGYLADVIRARDLWMHRIDLSLATGRSLAVTGSESEVVTQVVRDLARFWNGPVSTLTLTGHGAGRWQLGAGDPVAALEADAVQLCLSLSGREVALRVSCDGEPAAETALRAARVLF